MYSMEKLPKSKNPSEKELFPPNATYTYKDLDAAHASHLSAQTDSERTLESAHLDQIEMSLKKEGAIPASEEEVVEFQLDQMFPKAKSRDIIDFADKKYQLKFIPKAKDANGKVIWGRSWLPLENKDPRQPESAELFAPDMLVTLDDLDKKETELTEAEAGYAQWSDERISNRENNPGISRGRENKIQRIETEIMRIELSLKKRGLLPTNGKEKLEFELDKKAGATAKQGDITELNGKMYKLRFVPLGKSRKGTTVRVWWRRWQKIPKDGL